MSPTTLAAATALALALAMAMAAPAFADDALDDRPFVQAAAAAPAESEGVRHFGVMLGAGVPEGAMASLVVRPVRALRLHGGVGYNGIRTGYQGGVTLIPFASWFTPTLTADYGEFPEGNATALAHYVDPTASSPALQHVGYRYANARIGLEFGRKRATFYIAAGISRITGTIHGAFDNVNTGDTMVTVTASDPRVEVWSASARIGWVIYL